MQIGLNAQRLAGQRLGIGRYLEYMLKHWNTMLHDGDQLRVFVRDPFDPAELGLSSGVQVEQLSPPLTPVLWENLLLPRQSSRLDVLYCPSYTVPLLYRGRCVVAIHSLNEAQSGTHPWWYHLTYSLMYRLGARKAHTIIVPSESTRQDVIRLYNVPPSKIVIIPQGADDSFRPLDDPEQKRKTRVQFVGSDRPYLLFVGKLSQRRNIPLLLSAFSLLKQRENIPHALLLVGPNHLHLPIDNLARELGIADSVIQTDGKFADHQALISIYNAADVYVNPSLYEGFSMTLVEALACGLPVVVSNRAALAEIADGCGMMIDDITPEAFADAIHRVLTDSALNQRLRLQSIERSHAYRWQGFAAQTLDVLRQAAK